MIFIVAVLIITSALIFKLWWRPKVYKKIIEDEIIRMGGKILSIELISMREEIYTVEYNIGGKNEKKVLKFGFMNEIKWK